MICLIPVGHSDSFIGVVPVGFWFGFDWILWSFARSLELVFLVRLLFSHLALLQRPSPSVARELTDLALLASKRL